MIIIKIVSSQFRDEQVKSHTSKNWTWLRKGNLKREIESLLTAAQNNR